MNKGNVQGLSLCLLNEKASPVGANGAVAADTGLGEREQRRLA